jgi:hypothetical protein
MDGPFVSHFDSWEPCYLATFPDSTWTYILDILWLQEKGAQMPRFHPLLHTFYTV